MTLTVLTLQDDVFPPLEFRWVCDSRRSDAMPLKVIQLPLGLLGMLVEPGHHKEVERI